MEHEKIKNWSESVPIAIICAVVCALLVIGAMGWIMLELVEQWGTK